MPRDFQSMRLRPMPDRRRMPDRRADWRGERRAHTQRSGMLASVPRATGDASSQVESLARQPTHDEIASRAYQLYEARGGEQGRAWEDWLQAERELR